MVHEKKRLCIVQYVTNFVDRNTLNTSNIREKKSLTSVSLVIPAFQSKQNKVHEGKKLKNFNTWQKCNIIFTISFSIKEHFIPTTPHDFLIIKLLHTLSKHKRPKRAGGQKIKTKLVSFLFFVPEHRKLAFSNTGLSFRRISGTGSNCPQQHDAHLLLNKLCKTRQNTVGETKTTAFWRLLLQQYSLLESSI